MGESRFDLCPTHVLRLSLRSVKLLCRRCRTFGRGVDKETSHRVVWGLVVPVCSAGRAGFAYACILCRLGSKVHLPHSLGGTAALPLLVFVRERTSSGTSNWRVLLGVTPRFVEGRCSLMTLWCSEGDVPTSANLNLYGGSGLCVRWHSDDAALFGERGDPKLIASLSICAV